MQAPPPLGIDISAIEINSLYPNALQHPRRHYASVQGRLDEEGSGQSATARNWQLDEAEADSQRKPHPEVDRNGRGGILCADASHQMVQEESAGNVVRRSDCERLEASSPLQSLVRRSQHGRCVTRVNRSSGQLAARRGPFCADALPRVCEGEPTSQLYHRQHQPDRSVLGPAHLRLFGV